MVHLDLEASSSERLDLAEFVRKERVFAQVGNVRMIVRANLVTYRGPTMVTNTLHAAAILLKEGGDWDWFINLSASDYPLVTQDGKGFLARKSFVGGEKSVFLDLGFCNWLCLGIGLFSFWDWLSACFGLVVRVFMQRKGFFRGEKYVS